MPAGSTCPRGRGPTTSTSSRNAPAASTTGDRAAVSNDPRRRPERSGAPPPGAEPGPSGPASAESGTGDVGLAVRVLRRGGLVAFPTETVYGLGCDAESGDALTRLY